MMKKGNDNRERTHTGRRGAPPLLTPEVAEKMLRDVAKKRVFDAQIAIRNGIHPDTLKLWIKKGLEENAEEPYRSFAQKYAAAQIDDESDAVSSVLAGTEPYDGPGKSGDWKAAAWYLERKYPKRWNPNRQPEAGVAESVDVESILRESAEQGENLAELLRNPPPALLEAMKEAREELKALLAEIEEPMPAQPPELQR
jgi:hypothetical protein